MWIQMDVALHPYLAEGFIHRESPVAWDIGEVGDGHDGERQRSGRGRDGGEAHAQGAVPAAQIFLHPETEPLLDLHRAAAEHQAVLERVVCPLSEATPSAQPDLVARGARVEGQRAEAGQAAPVGRLRPNNCKEKTETHC